MHRNCRIIAVICKVVCYNAEKFHVYTKTTVISHIRDKHISAVLISGKYIVPKSAFVDFIVSDAAFEIVNKSPWLMNTILQFAEE